jgi:hypothetical protein
MFARIDIYLRLHLLLTTIYITCISLSLRRTSAPIHLTSILGVLGRQETSCIVIVGLFERDSFDLLLPEFDKPWVIHLRETCCCSTDLSLGGPTLSTRIEACVDINAYGCLVLGCFIIIYLQLPMSWLLHELSCPCNVRSSILMPTIFNPTVYYWYRYCLYFIIAATILLLPLL